MKGCLHVLLGALAKAPKTKASHLPKTGCKEPEHGNCFSFHQRLHGCQCCLSTYAYQTSLMNIVHCTCSGKASWTQSETPRTIRSDCRHRTPRRMLASPLCAAFSRCRLNCQPLSPTAWSINTTMQNSVALESWISQNGQASLHT